jgi:Tetracyclin repressor-like, C-terminal domain
MYWRDSTGCNRSPLMLAEILEFPATSWDKRIAADLTAEIERHLAEKVSTIPEMRRFLAIKGYRELQLHIESAIKGRRGVDALRAMAISMRQYAMERPGLSAATFRSPATDSPEWRDAQMQLAAVVLGVFSQLGIAGEPALHALRLLRSFVRGFVMHEMSASFLEPLEYDKTYELGIDMFVEGLSVLKR